MDKKLPPEPVRSDGFVANYVLLREQYERLADEVRGRYVWELQGGWAFGRPRIYTVGDY